MTSGENSSMSNRTHLYVQFMPSGELAEVPSFDAAIALTRGRYPDAHYGTQWQPSFIGENLPVWANAGAKLRFELGETQDERKPVAYAVERR